jgi:uncharacterized protein YggE
MKKKNLIVAAALSLAFLAGKDTHAQIQYETPEKSTFTVMAKKTTEFTPDYYLINVSIQEFEKTNPDNQEVVKTTIKEVEKKTYDKLKQLKIKKEDIETLSVSEIKENTNFNYAAKTTYNTAQKRKLNKLLSFKLNSLTEVEQLYKVLRFNGVFNITVSGQLREKNQIKCEEQLMKSCLKIADAKAQAIAYNKSKTITLYAVQEQTPLAYYNTFTSGLGQNYNMNYNYQTAAALSKISVTLNIRCIYSF